MTPEFFSKTFAAGPETAEILQNTGINSTVALKASSGAVLTTRNAYCSEGEDSKHLLLRDGTLVKDHVDPCSSISAIEIVGSQLWLGTRTDGEYGDYPAEGIVVQSLDKGGLLKTLGTQQGLTGDLVRAIRFDSFNKTVWVATNRGINEIDKGFGILRALFFYQELDSATGARFSVSPTPVKNSSLAALFMRLQVRDAKAFYEATRAIPPAVQEAGLSGQRYDPQGASSAEQAFAPKAMNTLVPFVIESARSSDSQVRWAALRQICSFNDTRVITFLIEQSKLSADPDHSSDARTVLWCLEKFTRLGLISAEQKNDQVGLMLKQESEALAKIRASDRYYPGLQSDLELIVRSAKGLKQAGDLRGMGLINDYFASADGTRQDERLFEHVGQNLVYEDEIAPAMIAGLRKITGSDAYRGCMFFDMRWKFMPRRFDARYAEAMLVAIDGREPGSERRAKLEKYCNEAFKSQLGDVGVREAFFADIYPRLTLQQQSLADKLGKEPPAPRR